VTAVKALPPEDPLPSYLNDHHRSRSLVQIDVSTPSRLDAF
jgi:hypothetical protein